MKTLIQGGWVVAFNDTDHEVYDNSTGAGVYRHLNRPSTRLYLQFGYRSPPFTSFFATVTRAHLGVPPMALAPALLRHLASLMLCG
jgi:hypothetical protein